MSRKYVVEYTTVNPVYEEGAKTWNFVRCMFAVSFLVWLAL